MICLGSFSVQRLSETLKASPPHPPSPPSLINPGKQQLISLMCNGNMHPQWWKVLFGLYTVCVYVKHNGSKNGAVVQFNGPQL